MTSSPPPREEKQRWRPDALSWLASFFALIGVLVLAYPSAASWVHQYNQSQIINRLDSAMSTLDPSPEEQLTLAREYNNALSSGARLEANSHVPTGNGQTSNTVLDYSSLLLAGKSGLMGRIRVQKIDVDLPIYHGTSDVTLLAGIGHLEGTSLPVGGVGTRTVLTGHRGLAEAEMFTRLDEIGINDTFTLEVFGETLTYRVIDTQVIEPEETEALRADPTKDLATLVTCTPLGINTHRILVTGERVWPTPVEDLAHAGEHSDLPRFPLFAVGVGLAVFLIIFYLWRAGRRSSATTAKKRRRTPLPRPQHRGNQ